MVQYKVEVKRRYNDTKETARETLIKEAVKVINTPHSVDVKNPEKVVNIEVIKVYLFVAILIVKGAIGISVTTKEEFPSGFNIRSYYPAQLSEANPTSQKNIQAQRTAANLQNAGTDSAEIIIKKNSRESEDRSKSKARDSKEVKIQKDKKDNKRKRDVETNSNSQSKKAKCEGEHKTEDKTKTDTKEDEDDFRIF